MILTLKKPSRRLRKVGGIAGIELLQLTTAELDACLIIWPQLADGGWVIPDYNKISRMLNVTYIQAYCFIRKVIGKGILAKEGNHVRKVKTDFIYWKGKGGKKSQICGIELVEYRQAYNLNELSKSVRLPV